MDIRSVIEAKIKAAGLKKNEVAKRAGIIPTNLNGMITTPTWATLERIAAALGLSVSELVRDDQTSEAPTNPAGGPVCPRCGAPLVISITTPAGVQNGRGHAAPLP